MKTIKATSYVRRIEEGIDPLWGLLDAREAWKRGDVTDRYWRQCVRVYNRRKREEARARGEHIRVDGRYKS